MGESGKGGTGGGCGWCRWAAVSLDTDTQCEMQPAGHIGPVSLDTKPHREAHQLGCRDSANRGGVASSAHDASGQVSPPQ